MCASICRYSLIDMRAKKKKNQTLAHTMFLFLFPTQCASENISVELSVINAFRKKKKNIHLKIGNSLYSYELLCIYEYALVSRCVYAIMYTFMHKKPLYNDHIIPLRKNVTSSKNTIHVGTHYHLYDIIDTLICPSSNVIYCMSCSVWASRYMG